MEKFDDPDFLFYFDHPAVPTLPPALGSAKLWEMEEDNAYLKYLYPSLTRKISLLVEEECDRLEYEGSQMFDMYPDKTALQLLAAKIWRDFQKKYPDDAAGNEKLLRNMIEVLLFHEVMYRRNRYRNHKRLYL